MILHIKWKTAFILTEYSFKLFALQHNDIFHFVNTELDGNGECNPSGYVQDFPLENTIRTVKVPNIGFV